MELLLLNVGFLRLSLGVHFSLLVIRKRHHTCHIMITLVGGIWLTLKLGLGTGLNHHSFAVVHLNNILWSLALKSFWLGFFMILWAILHKLRVHRLLANVVTVEILWKLIHLSELLHLHRLVGLLDDRLSLNGDNWFILQIKALGMVEIIGHTIAVKLNWLLELVRVCVVIGNFLGDCRVVRIGCALSKFIVLDVLILILHIKNLIIFLTKTVK